MSKIVDSFLFFQELDLLEIRLEFLDPHVDLFVISEAGQTFSGKKKEFIFEKNISRFKKYLHKIHYQKIEDTHDSYGSIIKFLSVKEDPQFQLILKLMNQHSHYPKTELHWVLDTYHRECLHLALNRVATSEDIILVSDLDEIPSEAIFELKNIELMKSQPRVLRQKEFRYFLNYYKDSQWLGTIGSKYQHIQDLSLNELRIDSKARRQLVAEDPIEEGGFHFTTCGGLEAIKRKIEGWGHQEFNNPAVLKNLQTNIEQGKDIFYRELGTNLVVVNPLNNTFFERRLSKILQQYPHLISNSSLKARVGGNFRDALVLLLLKVDRLRSKLRQLLWSTRT